MPGCEPDGMLRARTHGAAITLDAAQWRHGMKEHAPFDLPE
jgi:hypothetical protein